jgi:hypothetical protein
MNFLKTFFRKPVFIRLRNWEYWPFTMVYGPILPFWFWECIKSRSLFFFNASNPSIDFGGFAMESKMDIYKKMPKDYYPVTFFAPKGSKLEWLEKEMELSKIQFPCIVKPDIGGKGKGVKKIFSLHELELYSKNCPLDFLVQDLIPYPNEVGIFYCWIPTKKTGEITGIVQKEFLGVIGDGISSIRQLIFFHDRANGLSWFLMEIMPVELNFWIILLKRIRNWGNLFIIFAAQ